MVVYNRGIWRINFSGHVEEDPESQYRQDHPMLMSQLRQVELEATPVQHRMK